MSTFADPEPTLSELRYRFRTGGETPLGVAQRVLDRIAGADEALNAFLAVDVESVLTQAEQATLAWRRPGPHPPLLGIPVSVKDTIEVAGMPTTYGSSVFTDNVCPDSLLASRLRASGAVIIGKTNTPEFALITEVRNRLRPPGRNALDPTRTCGGSSGGAAASVAAGMSAAAIGTDSAGSIRIPAAYHGLVGLKPSYQRIPWVQRWKASLTRSHAGPITRDAADAWTLLKVLSGSDWRDPSSILPALAESDFQRALATPWRAHKVALILEEPPGAGPGDAALTTDMAAYVKECFADVTVLSWEDLVSPPAQHRIWPYSAEHVAAALALKPDFPDLLPELTEYARPVYADGLAQSGHEYLRATGAEKRRGMELRNNLARFDYVFAVVAPEAPTVSENYEPLSFARLGLLNNAGVPAVSVPFGSYPSGMPRALQIIGRFGDDAGVLALAELLPEWAGASRPNAAD